MQKHFSFMNKFVDQLGACYIRIQKYTLKKVLEIPLRVIGIYVRVTRAHIG